MSSKIMVPAGTRFGMLVFTGETERLDGKATYWKMKCDCGRDFMVVASVVRQGRSKSCGCATNRMRAEAVRVRMKEGPKKSSNTRPCRRCGGTDRIPRGECRACLREQSRKWRADNRDRARQIDRESHSRNREARNEKSRRYMKEHSERIKAENKRWRMSREGRDYYLQSTYGISIDEYEKMYVQQLGACGICQRKLKPFDRNTHLDHCHQTGCVRGILCDKCNRGIGYFGEDAKALRAAARYVEREDVPIDKTPAKSWETMPLFTGSPSHTDHHR